MDNFSKDLLKTIKEFLDVIHSQMDLIMKELIGIVFLMEMDNFIGLME